MPSSTRQTAEAYYAAIHTGDFDALFELLSDDCVIEYYGPPSIPFAGTFIGKEKCRIFFGHVAEDVDIVKFDQNEFIVDGAIVAVVGQLVLRMKSNQRIYDSEYVHVMSVKNGQVNRFRDFQNTAKAVFASMDIDTPLR